MVSTVKDRACGQKWRASFAKYDPVSHSLKTAQCSLFEGLTESCQILPRWGLMHGGVLYQQAPLVLHTAGNVSGLLPTPTRATADKEVIGSQKGRNLVAFAKGMWPTPLSRDHKSGALSTETRIRRNEHPRGKPLSEVIGGQLNPTWVEWLMGWPLGWTDLKPLATDKCRNAQHQPGESYQRAGND